MYDVEITEGFDGRPVEKLGTCMSKAEAYKAINEWTDAHPECGPCNPHWRFIFGTDGMVVDYGSHTHFGKIVYRNRVKREETT
jgi:hypothetical protein